jgi:flagellar motility protein MotE (MotC chaperone)
VKSVTKYLRLLPAVVIVGTGLLAIKGVDLARAATAPTQNSDEPDNSGLAPTDNGGAPATRDFAAENGSSGSAAEVDVLSSLTRRRAELDARERALNMRENLLSAGEGRVDQKIGALKNLQTQIQALLVTRDAKQDDQIKSLVKTYSAMKPKDAARIFNSLSDDVLVPVARDMKSDVLAPVLAAMNPDAAQKLTVKLAMLLKLPEPPPALCPTAPGATPGTQADLTAPSTSTMATITPPLQTAALSPPGSSPVVTPLPLPPAPPPAPPAATPAVTTPAAAPPSSPPVHAAAAPPKPHAPPVHHAMIAKPTTTPPAKPTTAAATPPAKPTVAAATPPAKPLVTAAPPAAPPTAVTPAAATPTPTPPAKPTTQAASGPPVTLTPTPGG